MDNGLDIVGGMTENHLMTLDLRKTGKTGKDMANVLERVGITANKNTVPMILKVHLLQVVSD